MINDSSLERWGRLENKGLDQQFVQEIIKGSVSKDHVHLFVSIPPYLSISNLIWSLKEKTSEELLSEYKKLLRQFWGRHMQRRAYFAASSGNVTDKVLWST